MAVYTISGDDLEFVALGDRFSKLDSILPEHRTYYTVSEGVAWNVKEVSLDNQEYLLFQNSNGNLIWGKSEEADSSFIISNSYDYRTSSSWNLIMSFETNSSKFKTSSGVSVGHTLNDAIRLGERVSVFSSNAGYLLLRLDNSGVYATVETAYENLFFENGGEELTGILSAKIVALKMAK